MNRTQALSYFLRSMPAYLFMLPAFFVWHGYIEYYSLISFPRAIKLTGIFLGITILVLFLCWLIFKNLSKAALFAFFLLLIYFFFGSAHDFIIKHFPGSFITRYSFILPAIIILTIVTFLFLKKSAKNFITLTIYLNTALFLLLSVEVVTLCLKINKNKSVQTIPETDLPLVRNSPKPDIYLIVADGYSGNTALKKFFNYDNMGFENSLKEKGFFITDSSFSNYNYTIFSIGSLLNMNYLKIPGYYNGRNDLPVAFNSIHNNQLTNYLQRENYEIYNYSEFDFKDHPMKVKSSSLEFEKNLLKSQTLIYRIKRDLGYHLITTFKLKFLQPQTEKLSLSELTYNETIESLTRTVAVQKRAVPKFVYSHFIMPHWPYYFDSLSQRIPESKLMKNGQYGNKSVYLGYLKYSSLKILDLITYILEKSGREAIIIIVSDHGCRECLETDPQKEMSELLNINAVYFPDKNYTGFYKGMSNVNLFRVLLNSQFNKKLPLVKDSLILLRKE